MRELVGKEYEAFRVSVEKRWIRSFAEAIGEEDPIYRDERAAAAAGYAAIPAPPTFPFTIAMEASQPLRVLDDLGVDKTRTVHGEQAFSYHQPVCAGDEITGRQKVVDMYDRKGGAMTFVVTETALSNQRGERVCDLRTVIVVRNG
jgi:acyl dehydratase